MKITHKERKKFGSYSDRDNSFDDQKDIDAFIEIASECHPLRKYLMKFFVPTPRTTWSKHPDGDKGIDLAIVTDDERNINIDIERWSAWDAEWPKYYKYIHFLSRKDRYLKEDVPFLMCFMNYSLNKVLIVDKETILCYPTKEKYFKNKGMFDTVRELQLQDGHIFGKNLTEREKRLFTI